MAKRSKSSLYFETDGSSVYLFDHRHKLHQFRASLIREAESGDGMMIADDLQLVNSAPRVTEHMPWGCGGAVVEYEAATDYLSLMRKRFSTLFHRPEWVFILSPYYLKSQATIWRAALRECGIKKYRFQANLSVMSSGETEEGAGVFLYWGNDGFDIGCCLHGEVYQYERVRYSEREVVRLFQNRIANELSLQVDQGEAGRILEVLGGDSLNFPEHQLVEIATCSGLHESVHSRDLLEQALSSLQMPIVRIESFLKNLTPRDHADLFQQGVQILGRGRSLSLLAQVLSRSLEIPVWEKGALAHSAIHRIRALTTAVTNPLS